MGYGSKNALDKKSTIKLAIRPILRRLTHKTKILQLLEFLENYKDWYGKNRCTALHAFQQLFSYKSLCVRLLKIGPLTNFLVFFPSKEFLEVYLIIFA